MTSLFKPSIPAPTPPPTMPTPNGDAEMQARRRAMAEAQARSGRQSTILSGGTSDYSGSRLGASG